MTAERRSDRVIADTTIGDVTAWWRTDISDISPGTIRYHGYAIEEIIPTTSYAAMVWLMIRGERPSAWQERLLDAALVAAVDHGPQAPSIAAARMAATCGVGLNNVIATGVGMLGDVHGGAGEQCMELLADICDEAEDPSQLRPVADRVVARYRAARRYVPGFGHRFHPRDPRRDPLMDLVALAQADRVVTGQFWHAALALEAALAAGRSKPVPMNIDGATAVVYAELGFPPALGRGLFVLSRSVGILAHGWEQTRQGGRNKGPIPRTLLPDYTGRAPRSIDESSDPCRHDKVQQ
ncbi:citryl-CoA lyase [Mycolicibacterium nivoides]|uniref:citryl-CoA lyase n=1 Tax=Mycolicibacterium nivoides TaxID=2487344 RepID=UPI003C2E9E64